MVDRLNSILFIAATAVVLNKDGKLPWERSIGEEWEVGPRDGQVALT
jgi:hypothetical protein